MASRKLDDLTEKFRPVAFEFLARLVEARIHVLVVCTLRSIEEQRENIARGVSWTMHSKHLPQEPDGKARAIDLVPVRVGGELDWDEQSPTWQKIGRIGRGLGLKWGVINKGRRIDLGHFEYVE